MSTLLIHRCGNQPAPYDARERRRSHSSRRRHRPIPSNAKLSVKGRELLIDRVEVAGWSLTKHPWRYDHERARSRYLATQVDALPIVAALVRHRAWFPAPVKQVTRFENGMLPVPGEPRVVFCPGHTLGHCALHLPDRDVLIAGDALVMLDPYTARRGPRLVARAAVADSERNMRSLDALAATGARTVLTGHGEP